MRRDIDALYVETDAKGRKATKDLNSHWSQPGARRFKAAAKIFSRGCSLLSSRLSLESKPAARPSGKRTGLGTHIPRCR